LSALAECVEQNSEALSQLLTRELGRPLLGARQEVQMCAAWFRAFAQLSLPSAQRRDSQGREFESTRVPFGVVAAIAPWNYPLNLAVWKVAPALLAGNTVVLKPSPYTPLTTLKLGELVAELVPAGVLNVISGSDRLGPWLAQHERVAKVAFTGSTATGRRVMEGAARTLKRLTLELGGNDPAIVLPDVDVTRVARKLFIGAFFNSGQICIAAKRIYVHDDIYDAFATAFANAARSAVMGPGDAPGTTLGPVQNKVQYERVKELIADCHSNGYRFLAGGQVPEGPGWFIPATVVDNPPDSARVVVEEPFGPIVPLLRWREVDDVVRRANDSEYGLGASVWSTDIKAAKAIASRLEAGTVWINNILLLDPLAPLGGQKQSGLGVENALEGLLEYTQLQTVIG
jgi:acyl-CoA reductase-like NAD-dependent aldehyde dehydrogenase